MKAKKRNQFKFFKLMDQILFYFRCFFSYGRDSFANHCLRRCSRGSGVPSNLQSRTTSQGPRPHTVRL